MSIEKNIESIAKSLAIIAAHVEKLNSAPGSVVQTAAAPVQQAAAAPVAQAPVQQVATAAPVLAAAAPVVHAQQPATFAAPVQQATAAPVAQAPQITNAQELNDALVAEHARLQATYGEAAFQKIMEVLQSMGFSSVQQVPQTSYTAVVNAAKAIV